MKIDFEFQMNMQICTTGITPHLYEHIHYSPQHWLISGRGRPKGSKNKFNVSEDLKKHIADLLAYKTERDFSDLDTMSPYERQRLKNELRKYVHPTMKSIEIDPNPVNEDEPKMSLDEFFKWKD